MKIHDEKNKVEYKCVQLFFNKNYLESFKFFSWYRIRSRDIYEKNFYVQNSGYMYLKRILDVLITVYLYILMYRCMAHWLLVYLKILNA